MLEEIIATITVCIDEARTEQMHEAATLLSIARLDLLARLHGITERELEQIMLILDRRRRAAPPVLPYRPRRRGGTAMGGERR